jgi:hypothetical protein
MSAFIADVEVGIYEDDTFMPVMLVPKNRGGSSLSREVVAQALCGLAFRCGQLEGQVARAREAAEELLLLHESPPVDDGAEFEHWLRQLERALFTRKQP